MGSIYHSPAYLIGDLVKDEDGNEGIVVIQWNDGDICAIENDCAHPGPVVIGHWPEMEPMPW